MTSTIHADDTMDQGPLREPFAFVLGHKVYRKEACTYDHKPVAGRQYFGLHQCSACFGIIAPGLKRIRRGRYATAEVREAA